MASINLLVDKGALPGPFRTLSLRSQLMSQRVRKQSCGLLTKDLILGSFAQSGHRCSVVGDDGARGRFSFVRQRQHTGCGAWLPSHNKREIKIKRMEFKNQQPYPCWIGCSCCKTSEWDIRMIVSYFCVVLRPFLLSFIQLWVFFLSITLSLSRMENQTLTPGII